jgi:hypothetical protein
MRRASSRWLASRLRSRSTTYQSVCRSRRSLRRSSGAVHARPLSVALGMPGSSVSSRAAPPSAGATRRKNAYSPWSGLTATPRCGRCAPGAPGTRRAVAGAGVASASATAASEATAGTPDAGVPSSTVAYALASVGVCFASALARAVVRNTANIVEKERQQSAAQPPAPCLPSTMSKFAPHRSASSNPRATAGTICQRCLGTGHFTYQCKNARPYVSRPSRTKQLAKPATRDRPSVDVPEEFKTKYVLLVVLLSSSVLMRGRAGVANRILEQKEKERAEGDAPQAKKARRSVLSMFIHPIQHSADKMLAARRRAALPTRTAPQTRIQTRIRTPDPLPPCPPTRATAGGASHAAAPVHRRMRGPAGAGAPAQAEAEVQVRGAEPGVTLCIMHILSLLSVHWHDSFMPPTAEFMISATMSLRCVSVRPKRQTGGRRTRRARAPPRR